MSRPQKPPFTVYLAASVVIFFLTLSAADSIGFVPCQLDDTCTTTAVADPGLPLTDISQNSDAPTNFDTTKADEGTLPTQIRIAAIGLDLPVQNPSTTDLAALDTLLQNGPARHAQTGKPGGEQNIVIFGHSSHLPIIHNQMFKAFNRVPELKAGDSVELDGEDGKTYQYSVISVEKEDANNDTENFLANPSKQLIIVTCDTLTGKSARYIVRADFVGVVSQ